MTAARQSGARIGTSTWARAAHSGLAWDTALLRGAERRRHACRAARPGRDHHLGCRNRRGGRQPGAGHDRGARSAGTCRQRPHRRLGVDHRRRLGGRGRRAPRACGALARCPLQPRTVSSSSPPASTGRHACGRPPARWPVAVLRGHTDSVAAAAINPAGTLAATASGDETARTWDLDLALELRGARRRGPCRHHQRRLQR